jgi:hypothetical protein
LFISVSAYDCGKYSICVGETLAGIWYSFLRAIRQLNRFYGFTASGFYWSSDTLLFIAWCDTGVRPPCETKFQASIERYNGQWQQSIWKRFYFKNFQELVDQAETYVKALRKKKN